MPGRGTIRAKQKRAGSLGQTSRLYTFTEKNGTVRRVPGATGYGIHKAEIGSMLSLGIVKQNKNAGGNNVCIFHDHLGRPFHLGSGNCVCRGPKAYCPNCWNRTTKCTISTH